MNDWKMTSEPDQYRRRFLFRGYLQGQSLSATVDDAGCFHLDIDDDYIHICDPRGFAAALIALVDKCDSEWVKWAIETMPREEYDRRISDIEQNDPGYTVGVGYDTHLMPEDVTRRHC